MRIAVIQHGDFRDARARFRAGGDSNYFGQRSTVEAVEKLIDGHEALVVSLDADTGPYDVREGAWHLVGLQPRLRRRKSATPALLAAETFAHLAQFRPTHVLLRSSLPFVSNAVLASARRARVAVIIASALRPESRPFMKALQRNFIDALCRDNVDLLANYCRPAVESLVDLGVPAGKVRTYAFAGMRTPNGRPPKTRPRTPARVAFFGLMLANKGATDLIDAGTLLAKKGRTVDLHMYGDGAERGAFEARAAGLPSVKFFGRVPTEECFAAMCDADIVVVPSRHDFLEGMPLALTEALASRAVVLCSDNPIFARTFRDREGLAMFRASDPASLARALEDVIDDPALYARLSAGADVAFARIGATDATFEDLVEDLARAWR